MAEIIRRHPGRILRLLESNYRPFNLLDEFETIARKAFDGGRAFREGLVHRLDVYREKDDLVVKAELPGIDKKDLDINLEDDVLTIKAENKKGEVADDVTYYHSERHFGLYSRTISLPFAVDADKVTASYENGLLEMRLPKVEEAKARKIEININ